MEQAKIDRINVLARKSKSEGLTEAEKAEQAALRAEYVAAVKASLEGHLDNTYFQEHDGTKTKLKKKEE